MTDPGRGRAVRSLADLAFVTGFTAYAAVAVVLLIGGLAAVLGSESSVVVQGVERLGGQASALFRLSPLQVVLDYLISAVNLVLGVLLVWLRPRHATARLLGVGMVGTAAAFNLSSHGLFIALAESWVNVLHFLLHALSAVGYLHALLIFPDGRLPRGWPRTLLTIVYSLVGLELLIILLVGVRLQGAGPLSVLALLSAVPFGTDALARGELGSIGRVDIIAADASFFVLFFGLLVPLVGLVAQLQRYRAATSALERQQSRLLAWALTVALAGGIVFILFAIGMGAAGAAGYSARTLEIVQSWVFRVFPLLFVVLPIALFTGILRYRLWDIDRAINRALTYSLLTGVLTLAYVLIVTTLGGLVALVGVPRLREFVIGFAMLAVAALFGPVRRRAQDVIDRRFYRRRYDAARSLQGLSAQLREEVDLRRVGQDVLATVEETISPAHASLWLRPPSASEQS